MKSKILGILALISCIFNPATSAEEIKYGFSKGAVYSYQYTIQESSQANAPILVPQKSSNKKDIDFTIKSIGFQNNAFILDIGNSDATIRRYLSPNGILKGSPAEDRTTLPFFIFFPEGDWKTGSSIQQNTEAKVFGQTVPIVWTLTLASVDSLKSLATINFSANFGVQDNKNYSRKLSLQGSLLFNMAEGVIHKANWETKYSSKLTNKEISVTRSIWDFQKQTTHNLILTGIQK